jgi:hypothetical protein
MAGKAACHCATLATGRRRLSDAGVTSIIALEDADRGDRQKKR